jgi:hypothetical protein
MTESLCRTCQHRKDVISGKGSRFLLCLLSLEDRRFPKYPPQPLVQCSGYSKPDDEQEFKPDEKC